MHIHVSMLCILFRLGWLWPEIWIWEFLAHVLLIPQLVTMEEPWQSGCGYKTRIPHMN